MDFRAAHYADLDFNSPLDSARALDLIASLRPLTGASIVDLGCGWAELLLRTLEAEPTARGVGVERDADLIERARGSAVARGLGDRLRLQCGDVTEWSEACDVVMVVGASHAWGDTAAMLDAVIPLLGPGGRLLLGDAIWDRPPSPEALAGLAAEPDDFPTLAGLVDRCIRHGLRLLALSTASLAEWDDFESRYAAGRERWLLEHPDATDAESERAKLDAHREDWLNGYRTFLGFAYLTLIVPPR